MNERPLIEGTLAHLSALGAQELIVVDGGSRDGTAEAAAGFRGARLRLIRVPAGRAAQMNAGARQARGEVLLFAHADLRFPPDAFDQIRLRVEAGCVGGGFFKRYVPESGPLRLYGWGQNRLLFEGLRWMVGTNGIFARRDLFERLGGFPEVPLLEDLKFSRSLRSRGRLGVIRTPLRVSARRYQQRGVWRQIGLNGRILLESRWGRRADMRLKRMYETQGEVWT